MSVMTDQEVFDTVARHLLTQGKQSIARDVSGGFMCLYRGPDGCKCAVGALIGDDEYRADMEEHSALELHRLGLLPERLVEHRFLLEDLQSAHDHTDSGPTFRAHIKRELREVAETYDLSTVVLEEAA